MKDLIKCYCGHTTTCDCGVETLEEAAERKFQNIGDRLIFEDGVKWQQERSYSEEELKEAFMVGHNICRCITDNRDEAKEYFREWFNIFKKK
jgi:hypothetical protein